LEGSYYKLAITELRIGAKKKNIQEKSLGKKKSRGKKKKKNSATEGNKTWETKNQVEEPRKTG